MRGIIGCLFLCLMGMQVNGQVLMQKAKSLAESSAVKNGRFSFYAKNLSTGETLISHDIERKLSPASTLKLLTTYAAMDILGPDHRFETKVRYSNSGDIIVQASGDPALAAERFSDRYGDGNLISDQIAQALIAQGIERFKGDIIIDEGIYTGIEIPEEWTWQDMGNYFATGAHAFTYKENMFMAYVKSGAKAGEQVTLLRSEGLADEVQVINEVKSASIRSDQAYFYSSPHNSLVKMYGRIPLNKSEFEVKGAVPDPAALFREDLERSMLNAGIEILDSESDPDASGSDLELITFLSPPLMDLVAYTNMKSNNLYAEHLLRQIGLKQSGKGSFAAGLKALQAWCASKGIDTEGLRIKDGSGLSRANSVSTQMFMQLLKSLSKESYFEVFKQGLPVAGQSGSMRRVGKDTVIDGKMYAKTGYIEDVRAYSGYLEKNGELIAFSIMANDYDLSASQMRVRLSELMVELGK